MGEALGISIAGLATAAVVIGMPVIGLQRDALAQTLEERVEALGKQAEEQEQQEEKECPGLDWPDISGFVDASWTWDENETQGDGNDASSFQLDGVEIDIEKDLPDNGAWGAALRADIDFVVADDGAGASIE